MELESKRQGWPLNNTNSKHGVERNLLGWFVLSDIRNRFLIGNNKNSGGVRTGRTGHNSYTSLYTLHIPDLTLSSHRNLLFIY